MGPIQHALADLTRRIPARVLETVFIKRLPNWRQSPQDLSSYIMDGVIKPRVLVDCDLVGGTEAYIPLGALEPNWTDDHSSVYRIPKTLTQGRTILSAINITFSDPSKVISYGASTGVNNSSMLQAGQAVADAHSAIPATSTSRVQIIGENTILVRDTAYLPSNVFLRCLLGNDENMSHIQAKSYRHFTKLVELAVKSFIYMEYIIELDMGEIVAGQSIGKFKDIVEGYADAEEMYQDFLTNTWEKVSFMNDNERYTRYLKLIIGGSR